MAETFVLVDEYASAQMGTPIYFQKMTAIGPMTTADPSDAAVFADRIAACSSPAWRNQMCLWKVTPTDTKDGGGA